jgi:hypothetical protein
MTSEQLVIILLAAFWAGMNSVISGIKIANEARDRILSDTAAAELSKHHKKMILWADYIPMIAGLAAVSVVFGGVVVFLPGLADPGKAGSALFKKICWLASVVPFSGAVYFLIRGAVEFFQLRKAIQSAKQTLPTAPASGH